MTAISIQKTLQAKPYIAMVGALLLMLFSANSAFSQAGSPEAQKFYALVETTRADVAKASAQFDATMDSYNAIVTAEVDNPEKAYKSLTKEIDKSEKAWKTADKNFEKMQKAGQKLFSGWQKEVDAFTNEQMKQVSVERLEEASVNNQRMTERMKTVQDAYTPFIASLKDQALYMGRDMSPAAMEALAPLIEDLNANADVLRASIDTLLNQDGEIDVSDATGESGEMLEVDEVVEGP